MIFDTANSRAILKTLDVDGILRECRFSFLLIRNINFQIFEISEISTYELANFPRRPRPASHDNNLLILFFQIFEYG
jgi:hypothetical protein